MMPGVVVIRSAGSAGGRWWECHLGHVRYVIFGIHTLEGLRVCPLASVLLVFFFWVAAATLHQKLLLNICTYRPLTHY